MGFDLSKLNKLKKDELYVDDEEEKRKKSEQAVSKQTSSSEKVALNPSTSIATNLTLPRSLAINQNNTNNNDLPTAKTSKTSSSTKSSNQNLKEINSSKIGVKNNIQYEDNKEEKETVLGKLEKSFLEKLKSKGNNSYKASVSSLPKASSLSKYEPIKNNQNIDDLSVEELQKNNIPITSNKDARLVALRNKDYYTKPKNTTSDYFKSSEAFEDGYQFGDVTKTALSTAGDIGVHATKSIMGIGEGIGDLITYARANSAEKKGDIEKANSLRQEAQQSAMDYIFNDAEHAVDKNSIIGDKGDQLVEGLGYIAGISAIGYATGGLGAAAGLSTAGASTAATVATTATTFSTSMGNGMTEAYQSGASNDEAFKYGLIAGLAEAGSELLFGGLGKASGAVGLSKSALPVDDLLAEQISNLFKSRLGKNLSQYAVKASAEGVEEVVSGFMQAIGKKVTYMSDVDLMQLIKDENLLEQFIDGTILSAIAQSPSFVKSTTKGNNFLSVEDNGAKNQNNSTTQRILQEQQRITPQEIKTAQNENMGQIDSELSVINESKKHTELSDMLNNKDLPMQYYQYEKSDNAKVNSLKESASKYFNNSEQTKNYISMLEQIVTDKNIEIRFEDNLKTPDGKTANGSYSDGVITINPNSSGTGEFIAVHELTHAIGTNEMVKMIENFKNSNVEFSTEMKALLDNYSSTEINEEALADVSAQLLGNQEFINNVAQNNSNIFKKIYSEIKYLWHQFRGYKNQNQFVEDLYYKWTKAYNSSKKLNTYTSFSIQTNSDGGKYVQVDTDQNIFEGVSKKDYNKIAKMYMQDYLMGETQLSENDSAIIDRKSANKYTNPGKKQQNFDKKMQLTPELKNVLEVSQLDSTSSPSKENSKYGNWEYYKFEFELSGKKFEGTVNIGIDSDGNKHFYEINKIKEIDDISGKNLNRSSTSSINNSIAPSNNDVNTSTKYSIQESENNSGSFNLSKQDNKGRILSEQQSERYKYVSELLKDENGNLKTYYHGTQRADRVGNYFNPEKATSGPMAFFTDNEQIATNYSNEKSDTSLSREYDTEKDLFKIDGKSLDEYWTTLSYTDKQKINENAKYVGFDEDWENIVFDKNKDSFTGQYDYYLKNETNNNGIEALYKVFVEDGNLFGEDIGKFKQALELAGVQNVDYLDPYKVDKKVYEVYLNIKNPFDTSNISNDIIKQFEVASKNATIGEQYSADIWDKSNISPEQWLERLHSDIENNTTHAWTVIPDWVTDVLKQNGYDGIADTGGKGGGQGHQVIIPFYSEQIKNVDNITPTDNPDIRYSTQTNSSWYDYLERTFPNKGTRTYAKDILVKKADNEGSYSTRNNTNNVANSLNTIYNNAKLGEVKQVPVETLLSIQNSTGGYRTQEQINNLKSDIRANGITTPIEIYKKNDGTFAIENGNHRLEIAQELGIKEVPVKLVKSWNDVGISKENVSKTFEQEHGGIFNDGITERNSNIDERRWDRTRSKLNDNVQFKDSGRTGRNAELYERTSNSNEFTSGNENKGNNRQQEVDDSTSFNMSNNAPSSDNNSFGTSTEENSWSRQQAEKKKQRKHYESIIKSNYTTDEAKAIAKELMGTDTYVPESNSRQLEVADERIASAGADSELNSLMSRATTGGNIKSDDIAVGERLIQYYSKTGDKFKLQEAIQATAMAGTTAGQTVQAMALLNHQTPEGQAIWLQRSVDKMNSDLRKTRGKNAEQFNLTSEMLEKVVSSENAKALEENLNEVYKELGQQVTKTTAQKIDAWRYFSMLSSPKTHIRNITGNTAMAGVQGIKNKVAGTIEGVVGKFNSDMERTHTLKIASKEVKSFAKADIENVADRLGLNENKYNPKTRLENNMRTFKSDVMEKTVGKVFEINNNLLEAEDGWGLKAGYVKALSEYMTANNLTPDTITDKQLSKARNYAVEQAKEATFHQDSKLASMINQFSNKNKFCKFILDSTLPFKKTPINVAKAGIEYSPVGLVKSAVYDTVKLRKGDITVNKYIDNISKGLTGTGIALVGYALADCGILKASGSDDEDRESFEEGRGSQNYSITIGDNTYSLDWLAPSGIPLFIGAECYELMQASSEKKTSSSDDDKIYNQAIASATNILDSFANAMNPMTEMSMLSGLTSALKSYDQGSSQMLASLGTNAVKSYVNQFFPTGLGQIAKTIDGYERSTTSTKTGVLPKAIDTTKNQIMSKIPVLRELLPAKTGTWGEEMKQSDNVLVRALENSVLPWTRKELNSTDVDKEILSVYENTGESSVFPDSINKNITIDKQKYTMTAGEYAKYKQQYGQTSYNLLNSLIKSSGYKKLSDEQKQLAIEKIYSYSTEQIKVNYAKQNGLNYKQSTLSSVVNSIKRVDGNTSNYFEFLAKTQDLTKESERVEILANSNYSNSTKTAIYENSLGKDDSSYKILKRSFTDKGLNITKYLKYKSQEFTSDKEDDGTVNGKAISGSKKDKVIDYINSISGTTYTQRILLYGLKYKPESISDRELIVNYIRDNWTGKERTEMFEQFTWIKKYKNGKIGI